MQTSQNNTRSPQNGQLHITGPALRQAQDAAAIVAAAILAELEQPGPSRWLIRRADVERLRDSRETAE